MSVPLAVLGMSVFSLLQYGRACYRAVLWLVPCYSAVKKEQVNIILLACDPVGHGREPILVGKLHVLLPFKKGTTSVLF
jgi:hypothetical protein